MKRAIGILVIFAVTNTLAQNIHNPVNQAVMPDAVQLVSIEKMPLPLPPGEAKKMQEDSRSIAADGFSSASKSPKIVKDFLNHFNAAKTYVERRSESNKLEGKEGPSIPEVHKDLSRLKLSFKEKGFGHGKLMAAAPSGTKINNAWTGLERFFQIEGVGSVRLSEVDLAASGGRFYMMKEAVNARVHGKPAISKIFSDDDGQIVEEVVWVNSGKFYMLTFSPDLIQGNKGKAASHITAFSLVHELY